MTSASRPLVAFVSDAQEYAGAEHYMIVIVEALRDRYEFVVVHGEDASDETRAKAVAGGAKTVPVAGLRRRPAPTATVRMWRCLRDLQPAIVHVNASDQGGGGAGLSAARFAGTPLLTTLHNVIPRRSWLKESLSRVMLRQADEVIAVSDRLGRYLEHIRASHVVVKNGLLAPRLDPLARRRLELADGDLVVGGIGRLHRQKGWDVFCRAAAIVHGSGSAVKFVVIGDGPERQVLRRLPECKHVTFVGHIVDASSLLGAFDLLVIPSRYEGLGLVAIEGMLSGVPILATDIEGLVEVVADCGRIVPAEDPERLAEAIVELAHDGEERRALAVRAQARAARLFTAERMVAETAAVYESLLSGRKRYPGGRRRRKRRGRSR